MAQRRPPSIAPGGPGGADAHRGRRGRDPGLLRRGRWCPHRDRLGPARRPAPARFASRGKTAVIEAAQACGISLLTPAPATAMSASSSGVGQLIRHALDVGCTDIMIGVGGTASTDGGAGLLLALGARMADEHGRQIPAGGRGLASLETLDMQSLDPRLHSCRLTVAADVSAPLLGPAGAACVFGARKGARAPEVAALDHGLRTLARAAGAISGRDHNDAGARPDLVEAQAAASPGHWRHCWAPASHPARRRSSI